MKPGTCRFNERVHVLVAQKEPAGSVDPALMQHIADCRECGDLWVVANAIAEDYSSAIQEARVPPAGLVWWRAELRARQEARGVANRPITVAQSIAAAGILGIVLGILAGVDASLLSEIQNTLPLPLLYASIGVIALLASVALYFVLSRD
jgi:hypothetical protein